MTNNEQPVHTHLPETGLHVMIGIAPGDIEAQSDSYGGIFVDISVEDTIAVMALGHFLTDPEGAESPDEESRATYDIFICSGRAIRWHSMISQDAIVAIRAFFLSTDFRQGLRGAEALREFESDDVKDARDTEVSLVQATWLETVAEA